MGNSMEDAYGIICGLWNGWLYWWVMTLSDPNRSACKFGCPSTLLHICGTGRARVFRYTANTG